MRRSSSRPAATAPLAAGIAALAIVLSACGGEADSGPTATAPVASEQLGDAVAESVEEATVPAAATPDAATPDAATLEAQPIGETADLGNGLTLTVLSVQDDVASLGNESFGAEAAGQYALVAVEVTNTRDTDVAFLMGSQKLRDSAGTEHSPSQDMMYLAVNAEFQQILATGETTSGGLVYDIPADATPEALLLDGGPFGATSEVPLG